MTEHYDLIAIGGGSGGIATARRAAAYGAHCAVIERGRLGGTCVNVGCVPKKVMWNAAHVADAVNRAGDYGFLLPRSRVEWAELVSRRENYVRRLNDIYRRNLDKSGVDLLTGYARFADPRTVEVDGARVSADHIVIATGGRPDVPNIPGAELGIDSDGFFALDRQPRRCAVVGAGYIAVELAGVLHHLGTETTLVIRRGEPLRSFDPIIRQAMLEAMHADRLPVLTNTTLTRLIRASDGTITAETEDGRLLEGFDALIWAAGRRPNSDGLALENAGVRLDADGFIGADRYEQTNVPGIYAIGDANGKVPLTPVAIAAGRRLADRVFGGKEGRHLDYDCIPTVVFSHPPIGAVGLTEAEARERYGDDVQCFQSGFISLEYALGSLKRRSAMKLVTVGPARRIVGVHLFGPGSDEMLQGFAVAVRMGATKQDFDDTVAIHPTSAEELVTMT